jgi:hypothetical protein
MANRPKHTLVPVLPNPAAIPAQLRFYDPELQNALNSEPWDPARFERARAKSRGLHAAYLKQLAKLAPRLSKRTYSRFSDSRQPLFDGDLLQFSFGDSLSHSRNAPRRKRFETSIQVIFRSFDGKTEHILSYRNIKSLNVTVPSERWFNQVPNCIHSLLADELTSAGQHLMRHHFLFVTGAVIVISFERVRWETRRT